MKNRYLHIDYSEEVNEDKTQSAATENSKCNFCTLNCTLDELAILKIISKNPVITQKQLADKIGKSERTIKSRIKALQEKGYIRRINGRRNGSWELLVKV